MSSPQQGRLPESVYRRRRIVVGLAALGVIAVIVLLIAALMQPRGDVKPSDTKTPGAGETPPATTQPSDACNPAVIQVSAVTDAASYPDGTHPLLSMEIVNTGADACTLDVGTDVQYYAIVSGSDPIWNSRDCQSDPAPAQMVIEPNTPLTTTPFAWDRTRSSTSTCSGERPPVTGGGATYRLSVSLGEIESASDTPFILN